MIDSTAIIGSRAVGLNVFESSNVTISNSIIGDVRHRNEMSMQKTIDKESCVAMCSYFNKGETTCFDNSITNSIAVGCVYAGFVVPGHDCGDSDNQNNNRGNVAHSVDGSGFHIFPDINGNDHATCYEGSHFASYKVRQHGIGTHFVSKEIRMTNFVSIDATLGVSLQNGGGEYDHSLNSVRDAIIYGETEALDCPEKHECWCRAKYGFLASGSNQGSKKWHIDSSSAVPMRKVKSYGQWASEAHHSGITFKNFDSNKTACHAPNSIFGLVDSASDFIPQQNF